jgi:hypothetical protein
MDDAAVGQVWKVADTEEKLRVEEVTYSGRIVRTTILNGRHKGHTLTVTIGDLRDIAALDKEDGDA